MAWQEVDDDACPGCGNALTETTDMAFRSDWQTEMVACHACRTKGAKDHDGGPGEFLIVTRRGHRG